MECPGSSFWVPRELICGRLGAHLEGYAGPAYGEAENIVFKMIANLAKVEGVFLDPVYTGKAFHGMVTELSLGDQGRLPGAKNIVFVHTGGLFGVFPHHKNFKFD